MNENVMMREGNMRKGKMRVIEGNMGKGDTGMRNKL